MPIFIPFSYQNNITVTGVGVRVKVKPYWIYNIKTIFT